MSTSTNLTIDGRTASVARRRALSAGKSALPASLDRVREGSRSDAVDAVAIADDTPSVMTSVPARACRDQARARRSEHSRRGRGDAPAAPPTRPPRVGPPDDAPRAVASHTQGGGHVTGIRLDGTRHVTGSERGLTLPVSGTQYIGADSGAAWRAGGPKVGFARTAGGTIVSGSLVRSKVGVTGDEAGHGVTVTGESDQRIDDDVTPRGGTGTSTSAQFQRQAQPHHRSAHANLGRSARVFGSRERERESAIESSEGGMPVTGSAIGRSLRVTGDEAGSCRAVTGDQYLAPARRRAECGGMAPAVRGGEQRPDPVTGAKVTLTETWAGRRVSGIDVEHDPRVTGTAAGACAAITGSPYQGARTTYEWCDDASVADAERRLPIRPAAAPVTGDTPQNDTLVTGTERGSTRAISGTPYYREAAAHEVPAEPVAAIDERFSVRSPQRAAHLRANAETESHDGANRITGSFAVGGNKVTGNLEFVFRPRPPANGDAPARLRITGEGRATGRAISGRAWLEQANVGGTEGAIASGRNPSERGGKARTFAGARTFKTLASDEEPKHLVTGMFGYSSDSAAKVTLSGGAQG